MKTMLKFAALLALLVVGPEVETRSVRAAITQDPQPQKADVFDHVRWDDLTEGAQVLALFADNASQAQDLIPRKPLKKDQRKDGKK
jgi:hypothetical protein